MKTKVIAHRGASKLAQKENTLEAFQLAIDIHADMVEFDVRQTSDGVLIVFHDSTFADAPISWQSYSVIEREAKERGFHIPTLEEVVTLCHGKIPMDIEIKETGFERKIVTMLKGLCRFDEYSIKSFKDIVVYKIKKLEPRIRTGLLVGKEKNTVRGRFQEYFPLQRLKKCGADFVSPYYKIAKWEFIHRMKLYKYPVYVWTVNTPSVMKRMLRYQVEGIISDHPDQVLKLRKEKSDALQKSKNADIM